MKPPFSDQPVYDAKAPWRAVDSWPAQWIHPAGEKNTPWVATFRCAFQLEARNTDVLHVTADERYELFLDSVRIGNGSERGDRGNWFFETYSLDLKPGSHVLSARVWALGNLCPWAQVTVKPGFLCCPEDPGLIEKIATGKGPWEMKFISGYRFASGREEIDADLGGGSYEKVDFRKQAEDADEGWKTVRIGKGGNDGFHLYTLKPIHWLRPATLPLRIEKPWKQFAALRAEGGPEDSHSWEKLLEEKRSFLVPSHSRKKLWLDLGDYICAYHELRWQGGAGSRITVGWAESLRHPEKGKTRSLEDGAEFFAPQDEMVAGGNGSQVWRPLWWRCGCFVEITVETEDEPLLLESLELLETRYPLEAAATWEIQDKKWNHLFQVCLRSAQMCAHETYMDCPYYEQLMYVGDARIQCLMTYALTRDDRLARKAVGLFDASRLNPSGWTTDAYPSDGGKIIPPFSLWWIGMVYDLALWREAKDLVKKCLPGIRSILDLCAGLVDHQHLILMPRGWNFVDSNFPLGVPPGGEPGGKNASVQLQYILALGEAAKLERYAGEEELAELFSRRRRESIRSLREHFWSESEGLFSEEPEGNSFSEQAQVLAFLADLAPGENGAKFPDNLLAGKNLTSTSAYFSHYLFAGCFLAEREEVFFERMKPWFQCLEEGFRTTPENFGQTRSECHAWSAHPLYHYFTGVLGIRPVDFAFSRVEIRPRPEELGNCGGTMPHPEGDIRVQLRKIDDIWEAEVELPGKLEGSLIFKGKSSELKPGKQILRLG